MLFKTLVRPVVFRLSANDPEIAHHLIMQQLAVASHLPLLLKIIEAANGYASPRLERNLFGLHFPNPIGLAGGFDKNGHGLPALAALGFGFIEAGTVTRYAQPGNPRPRIFRFSENEALINRMGFPNTGAAAIAEHLARQPKPAIPIGWSLGKSKVTPQEEAVADYLYSLHKLDPFADFFTVNVSSPNTPGLRQLQEKEPLDQLLHAIVDETALLAQQTGRTTPKAVLVKIAPDLTEEQIDDVIDVCLQRNVQGIIATNTTLSRTGLTRQSAETGGLSGRPLHTRAVEVVSYLYKRLEQKLPIIGVGGIFEPDDAKRMLDAGASLIQIYTSFIYEGPGIIKTLNKSLDHD
ncbi:quinone-dependent dihydroorotate dehydrogenase [Tengunoibacter tsumagoiensis]|uniref:Dihydroorotate dehydrogenase (quinone) n=1 Tax=Tengunoibacter tsumagoiensis TaxID=2014871 RepID=A0A401ZYZ8_9CHLR|nr:quinone-dependent dihydroorotate dehydrogenase [Tengunoibacter tsumagoiensis]GCE12057.1 dihydroorotate dehydrogenase (quinone) [Tengunoibacter tsumagoiensis]